MSGRSTTAVVILAGGASVRMGTAKHMLPFQSSTMGSIVIECARECQCAVFVSGSANWVQDCPVIEDHPRYAGHGPMAGIEAALASGHADRWLILPCDMPLLNVADLRALIDVKADACCFQEADGSPLPLPLMLSVKHLDQVRVALDEGRRRLGTWLTDLGPHLLDPPPASRLININTPMDYEPFKDASQSR